MPKDVTVSRECHRSLLVLVEKERCKEYYMYNILYFLVRLLSHVSKNKGPEEALYVKRVNLLDCFRQRSYLNITPCIYVVTVNGIYFLFVF